MSFLQELLLTEDKYGFSVGQDNRHDSDPVRPGYTWVNDRTVKGGGYFRKGEAKKDPPKVFQRKSQHSPEPEGPGISISEDLLEVDSEQEGRVRGALISLMDENITRAIDSIKQVHSLSGLPEFDIDLYRNPQRPQESGGMRIAGRGLNPDGSAKIAFQDMRLNLATPERLLQNRVPIADVKTFLKLTVIHEMGHTVDLTLLGTRKDRFASAAIDTTDNNLPNSADPELANLMTTLNNSQGAEKIRRGTANDPNLREYGDYLLSNNELFARAYTQYVATKSGDRTLQDNIQNFGISANRPARDTPLGHGHWDEEEFNSTILPEFDRIFANKGLLK
ncbi:hypothetical protein VF04_03870 [Nostoc linckia z7]|uniref:Uncharacterized protein n=2 Tax=Nostoc linckia TaxID=92942 RepID=A0A9Q5ZFY0_NOSLI|nr:hypothetical protein [Nostoc linckia]PHK42994.1 hypothetical protein VF12_01335 [Nostoc linckia z15]PHK48151.1 hypothetical protein VF13_02310 [Nostoc linckia z16]PHJ64935.1 hypothetical protein VF02_11360 [Nostoc linckia z1]PHJ70112.1 hypothetical protein VF05_11515 [Nostoc linckia z3]PHJ75013.1 hypothetical protein VF03_11675 [Nostoc linckia z2]